MVIAVIGIGKIEFFPLKENNINSPPVHLFLRDPSHPSGQKNVLVWKRIKTSLDESAKGNGHSNRNESIKVWHFSSLKVRINFDRLNEIKVPKSSNTVSYHLSLSTSTIFFPHLKSSFISLRTQMRGPG